ncbi:PAS domain S-box protein [Leptospira sp. 2 VSF19]|uniref:histidine kinase n=1 Tax=Leptospira soteropolitanensis TaxID=2950025 RepID=A0AAW5VL54_9LEPT|nr:PAS domain S-box protein [Leptospira soteropolitanensis]MCW7491769.1 PAS domain S-box protein [Leptospira soteropolitanensis]MCW7499354.1 PAS domain S-box protein [Leptospira soteropolitanensis]MCW7521055.1 PAS domain S-box protein [Leptospira soteropolitanensis]MCW7525457.1 PAS domain S-box protein [Leptospira soteropolitanensis]MCW7529324.1 PAS domain S-box protein [Leptospira soteropolitanensis]
MEISEYDFLIKLAAKLFESKYSQIASFDQNGIILNVNFGIPKNQTVDLVSISSEVLELAKDLVVIEDFSKDQSVKKNSPAKLEFNLAFFIGIPFFHEDGSLSAFISVLDDKPKEVSSQQIELFRELTQRVKTLLYEKDNYGIVQTNELILFGNNSSEKPLSVFGTEQAINEIKKMEKSLRISEDAFRENFDNAAIGMALLDETGRWLKVNKRVCDILGYSELEFMNLTFQDITHPEDLNADLSYLKELVEEKRKFYQMEKRYFRKNGSIVYAILAVSMVKNEDGKVLYFISQIVDVTEQKLVEQKLKQALAKNQAILDASTLVSIISTDKEGLITGFNYGAEKMLGYSANELIGKHTPKILHIESEIEEKTKSLSKEFKLPIEGFEIFIYNAKIEKPVTSEWTYKRKDGSTFPVLLSVTALKQNDQIAGYLGIAVDISELKKAEAEIQSLLDITNEQNNRLKNFTNIVSHNLSSHSFGISGMMEILQNSYPEYFQNEMMQLLLGATENLKRTIEDLTAVIKVNLTQENYEFVDIVSIIQKNVQSLALQILESKLKIEIDLPIQLFVRSIPAYLDSIVLNLITNAIKYKSYDRDSYLKIASLIKEKSIAIQFEDNGQGIDLKKHGDKLFGMYKTFHQNKEARGVGLFISKNQIETMGGKIEVESTVGVGTKFTVIFTV